MKKLLLAVTMLFATSSFAGILIEPQLGYSLGGGYSGSYTISGVGSANTNFTYSGVSLGGRLGYQMLGLMTGLNYAMTSGTSTCKSCSPNVDVDYSKNDLGVFVGYNFPILLRAWVAYNFSSKMTFNQNVGSFHDGDYYKGKSTEIGVGFTGFPFLSINAIYRMHDLDESKSGSSTYTLSGLKPTDITLAVSAPFNLF